MKALLIIILSFVLIQPTVVHAAKRKGFGAVLYGLGKGVKALGDAGKWVYNKALKPMGKGISKAATWVWKDAFGVGSKGTKGLALLGKNIGEYVFGFNTNNTKGLALLGKNISYHVLGINSGGTKGIAGAANKVGKWFKQDTYGAFAAGVKGE